jgi:hypothetical protein
VVDFRAIFVFSRSGIASRILVEEYSPVTLDQLHSFPFRTRVPSEFVDQASFVKCKLAASRVKIDHTALASLIWTGIKFEDCTRYTVDLEEGRPKIRSAGPAPIVAIRRLDIV